MMIKTLTEALRPLAAIADAYDANELDDEARKFWGVNYEHENTTPPEQIELYQGRGGRQLLTLAHALAARDALATGEGLDAAAEPLVQIARAYDANELDDEARKFWGAYNQRCNTTPPAEIELFQGRGGRRLLTLGDAIEGRAARNHARDLARRAA